jgi:hypothetical protein
MSEKRMLIVENDLLKKIDENRGEMSRSEFISFLLNSQIGEDAQSSTISNQYVTREEYQEFALGMKDVFWISLSAMVWNSARNPKTIHFPSWSRNCRLFLLMRARLNPPNRIIFKAG